MQYAKGRYGHRPVTPAPGDFSCFRDRTSAQKKDDGARQLAEARRHAVCEGCGLQMEVERIASQIWRIATPHWYFRLALLCEPCCEAVATGNSPGRLKVRWGQ